MRKLSLLSLLVPVLMGCSSTTSFVDSDTTLGRIVVYRNGVAYYERTAEVDGDTLELKVPADKVDDFLKSLTVIDAETQKPAPIAYPTRPGTISSDGTVMMSVKLTGNDKPKKLRLTYVTEAPSWKPSYRVVIGEGGKVTLMGWAIVDNTSGEDWKSVKLGVGSSSALSFRYDLSSIRTVARETLNPEDLFAQAPPTGGAVLQNAPPGTAVISMFDDNLLNEAENRRIVISEAERTTVDAKKMDKPNHKSARGKAEPPKEAPRSGGGRGPDADGAEFENQGAAGQMGLDRFGQLAQQINKQGKKVTIEGWASKNDGDKSGAALSRANQLRDRLIQNGVSPDQVVAVANLELQADAGGARVLEEKKPAAAPK
ncbi:MAG: DUF4139 domain-containing protein [Polyangiaceae bacterium]|nr:DUF4139 domain-containing protein [Polyangiaceae bacterium]